MEDLKQQLQSLRIEREPRRANYGKWLMWIVLLALLVFGIRELLKVRDRYAAVEVEVVTPSVQTISSSQPNVPILSASGYIVARRKAVVSAKIQGRLAELRVEEGSVVKEGEVIARLESSDYLAQIERAKAAIVRAEADLAEARRQAGIARSLERERVLSTDQRDAAESRVRLAEAALVQAKAELSLQQTLFDNTIIRAPFSGVVLKKMAEVGESVAPIPPGVNISTASGAIVAIADMASLEAEVDVNESNVAKLGANQPAEVNLQAFADRKYKGQLRQVIPTADRTKATVQVKVAILDKDKDLKPEMSTNVTFLEKMKQGKQEQKPEPMMYIAREAVMTRMGNTVVFEVRDGHAFQKKVTLGAERDGNVIVKSGLTGGEQVINRPPDSLKDGDRVRLKG